MGYAVVLVLMGDICIYIYICVCVYARTYVGTHVFGRQHLQHFRKSFIF